MENKNTAIQARDIALEQEHRERSLQAHDGAMIEAEKLDSLHGETVPTCEEAHEQEAQLPCSPQTQGDVVESKKHEVLDHSIDEATPADSHHEEPLAEQPESQQSGPEATASLTETTNTDNKSERGRTTSDLTEPDAAVQDEIHHANEAARRAPPQFHDEKIPVMAEPPQVRPISVAPGMVATSGPLEDFPFR
ncbi:hypothetical protein BDV97DRAFT_353091 [Delphinella strobiligena]|nr:hypothetical protein BDV97DRAFT_353091 [Delphinella strobiligena]